MRYSFLFLLVLFAVTAHAEAVKQNGFLIKSELSYSVGEKAVKISQEFILADKSNSWTTLTDLKEGMLLLGRKVKADKESIHLEFIVVDMNKKPNGVLSTPSIISRFGKPARIMVEAEHDHIKEKIAVTLTATPTEFTTERVQ